jgi:hypothetical protein
MKLNFRELSKPFCGLATQRKQIAHLFFDWVCNLFVPFA